MPHTPKTTDERAAVTTVASLSPLPSGVSALFLRVLSVLLIAVPSLVVVIAATPAAAQTRGPDRAEILAAKDAWDNRISNSYTMAYYYCGGDGICSREAVTVIDGVVTEARNTTAGSVVRGLTVEDVFDDLFAALEAPSFVTYTDGFKRDWVPEDGPQIDFYAYRRTLRTPDVVFDLDGFTYLPNDPRFQERLDLEAAEEEWSERTTDDYMLNYKRCKGINDCVVEQVHVVNGDVIRSTDQFGDPGSLNYSVEDLFGSLEDALDNEAFRYEVEYSGEFAGYPGPTEFTVQLSELNESTQESVKVLGFSLPVENDAMRVTSTCLAGNGRIDVNIVNDQEPAVYQLQVGSLRPRAFTVPTNSMWRSPVTGRPNGPIDVTVRRAGAIILEETVMVSCNLDPVVSYPEVDVLHWCVGGAGIVIAQMANPTALTRGYIVQVGEIRRSTTAAEFGAALRGVSGRPDGSYHVHVETGGVILHTETVIVDC